LSGKGKVACGSYALRKVIFCHTDDRGAGNSFGPFAALDQEAKPRVPLIHKATVQRKTLQPLKSTKAAWVYAK